MGVMWASNRRALYTACGPIQKSTDYQEVCLQIWRSHRTFDERSA